MKNKHKKSGNNLKQKLREEILRIFGENASKSFNYKQIASFLSVSDKQTRQLIFTVLTNLVEDGSLEETQRGKFRSRSDQKVYKGILDVSRKGDGFVKVELLDDEIFVPSKFVGHAIHGDEVEVSIKKPAKGKRKAEGVILKAGKKEGRKIVGTIDLQSKFAFLVPDDSRINIDVFIPLGKLNGGEHGSKAIGLITDWPDSAKNPFGEIVEVLGDEHSNEAEMKSILIASGLSYEFTEDVLNEANGIQITLDPKEVESRRDFRNILTFTIDPVDAKDFDDAISVEYLDSGRIRVGVHIADVGHYIVPGSHLDKEAYARGNSVYLVDRVIPMLPEHLSNGVCSLRPNEEKFTFSAVFDIAEDGEVIQEWFGKTVICSDRRFAYEEAQEIIEKGSGDHAKEILAIDKIAKLLRTKRIQKGALEIESSEIRFELDDQGFPINVYKKTTKDANKLVEEYMLLANRSVGKFIGGSTRKTMIPLIYRVHDKPDKDKVEQFRVFVSKFGKQFNFENDRDIALQMNSLFKEFKGENEFELIQLMAIKSMSKAVYDTENIGHYGLGFSYYAHFTSPIRRYADLMVHRILMETLQKENKRHSGLSETADHISKTERKAVDAERASKKYFQAKYLENQIGEIFKGSISGLTEWGMFVQMEENYCEGMIPIRTMKDDHYDFDEENYNIKGRKLGVEFNIGDSVFVKLIKVSLPKRQVDLELLD